ncbi:hypothetical protein VTK73DRAFT_932 [Phialemonium thermophilum]|uniref:xylan 1,4-beta-xylosidase n=1 Tax=Phialemonium thermophilum TaxID=223376 RepID=A0ABR3VU55_9PEZI
MFSLLRLPSRSLLLMMRLSFLPLLSLGSLLAGPAQFRLSGGYSAYGALALPNGQTEDKDAFLDRLVANMTVADLVLQLHLMFADDIVGPQSDNAYYNITMQLAPGSPIGAMHDWYPMNKSDYNGVQRLNLQRADLKVPLMQFGECLHGVGSFKQSLFPQSIGLSASFDTDLVHRVGRAIGAEARSIGIHACYAPVLDLGQDPRWGRVQEAWGEDKVLTSHMGVAYASGLSKNGSWADDDAVIPVMKHFAAHGAPQSGLNTAPFMGHGNRQLLQELLTPFKAAVQLGGARGVMMAYSEFDDIPAPVNPTLYGALKDWGFRGIVIADDTGMKQLQTQHRVASSPADAIRQWFEAGGKIQFYDYPLETYLNATEDLIRNGSLKRETIQSHVRDILEVKWDLGLFDDPYIPDVVDPPALVAQHRPLTLEAARKSIVLVKNDNATLPIDLAQGSVQKIALLGPFADTLNYGDYSGQWAQEPAQAATTIRQALLRHIRDAPNASVELVSAWGANSFDYNAQYVVPPYLLSSSNGTAGGLLATYYADTEFEQPLVRRLEVPALDWGLYPPPGLPSNNFSAVWEGRLRSPVDDDVDGWIGLAVGPNTTARLFVDGQLVAAQQFGPDGNIMSNIMPYAYVQANATLPPQGGAPFTLRSGATYRLRIEFQAFNTYKKTANVNSLNSQLALFWNLVGRSADPAEQATRLARDANLVILALGANWNSDGENGDRSTLGLPAQQESLARAAFALGKPVVLVLQGGRPFAIPSWYERSAAVLDAFFPGPAGGQAIADALVGAFSPGGRLPLSVPRHVGQLPVFYNFKPTAHAAQYVDMEPYPVFPFGHGLSYTTFETSGFGAAVSKAQGSGGVGGGGGSVSRFSSGDTITFSVDVRNNGTSAGSYVAQVYLLGRVSTLVQPVKQLVGFLRVYLDAGARETLTIDLEVDRYLPILNRSYEWELEKGEYTFALLENGGVDAATHVNVTLQHG